jgi:pimeloyl-ACP methyl ester carboxylesterase
MRRTSIILAIVLAVVAFHNHSNPARKLHQQPNLQAAAAVSIQSPDGKPLERIVDGRRVRLRVQLAAAMTADGEVIFKLDDGVEAGRANCPAGQSDCTGAVTDTLGWHWSSDRQARLERQVSAFIAGQLVGGPARIRVDARPVVMVHGFGSNASTWQAYLGPQGFLAGIGVQGFAVGDGQVSGVMNTGDLTQPAARTNTIAQNAAILGETIRQVKAKTGAEQVDVLAHSMGGLISRYYIARVMSASAPDVAQLLMLGSPMDGTACGNLPAALNFYLPAALEIRPDYVRNIFNLQAGERRRVPFYMLAGDKIQDPLSGACAGVPSDEAVSLASASAIPLSFSRLTIFHHEMTNSPLAFSEYVRPRLQAGADDFRNPAATGSGTPSQPPPAAAALEFNRIYTGKVTPGQSAVVEIPLEPGLTVASFALYDPSRSFSVGVTGASGNTIQLDSSRNGLVKVDDPAALMHLGYGFRDPKPGLWKVTLTAAASAPADGAPYALTASLNGGAALKATADPVLPQVDERVTINARLELDGRPLAVQSAQAVIRRPDGKTDTLDLKSGDGVVSASFTPGQGGVYGIDVTAQGSLPGGESVTRSAYLAVEMQDRPNPMRGYLIVGLICACALVLLGGAIGLLIILLRRRRKRPIQ